ncbi:hypothetical protein AB1Y20_019388 [Prymnesium parvum]|uniref:DUF7870 domain-containing protein n=1 Tax=Prymnesium parvum TaxID=97485 RepID=A0AB34JSA0_PRYPA
MASPQPHCVQPAAYRAYQVQHAACRQLLRFEDYCNPSAPPPTSLPLPFARAAPGRRSGGACATGRNVFIDLGANWCNTLQLYSRVPEAASLAWAGAASWEVYAFEASPLIAPFVERCCAALNAGRGLPPSPLPPAGSSMQLLTYAPQLGCTSGGRGARLACIEKSLEVPLRQMRVVPALTSNSTLLEERLAVARRRARRCGLRQRKGATYTLVPSAAGAERSSFKITTSPIQMLRGGTSSPGGPSQQRRSSDQTYDADIVSWLQESFSERDFVVLKMDIEGGERHIIPKLLATNASRLVDVLLWECHLKWRGQQGKCQCAVWEEQLRTIGGVRKVYREPYPFAGIEKGRSPSWSPQGT